MANSVNLSLTNKLYDFVNSRTGDNGLYATPSEHLCDWLYFLNYYSIYI